MEIVKFELLHRANIKELGREPKFVAYAVGILYEGNQGPMFLSVEEAEAYAKANDYDYVEEIQIF
jgi:hypothetical protein